ncbi:MAG: hypothetical protein ACI4T1_02375 [Christensenellales bacterium]
MSALKPLVMMQLKDKINLSFLKSKRQTMFKIIFSLIGFVLLTVVSYFVFKVCIMLNLFSVVSIIPTSIMVIVFAIIELFSIITCTIGLMKTLYFSPDNSFLLTMPTKSILVFASKIVVYYIYELIKTFNFLLPIFFAFGLISSCPITYYLWVIVCSFFIAALPVAIGALLSIPSMLIASFFKQQPILQIITISLCVLALVGGIYYAISLLPPNLNLIARWGYYSSQIQNFLNAFSSKFVLFKYLTEMIIGVRVSASALIYTSTNFATFGILIAFIVIVLALSFVVCSPLFLKMASKPFEYRKVANLKEKENRVKSPFISATKKEFKNNFRTTGVLYNSVFMLFFLPLIIFLFNKILSCMNTALTGLYMAYAFNILIILLISLTNNASLGAVYSKEGPLGPLLKTRPVDGKINLISKLVWNMIFSTVSIIISMILFQVVMQIDVKLLIMITFALLFITYAHIFWSAELDFMNPQFLLYQTFGTNVNNPNEKKANLIAFVTAFLVFLISLVLFSENFSFAVIKLLILSIIFVGFRFYTFLSKIKYYYKDMN